MILKEAEKLIIRLMLKSVFTEQEISNILSKNSITNYQFTGIGYFLEFSNPLFPQDRVVLSEPDITGETADLQLGFVLFLENKILTLECHSLGGEQVPKDIRSRKIELTY